MAVLQTSTNVTFRGKQYIQTFSRGCNFHQIFCVGGGGGHPLGVLFWFLSVINCLHPFLSVGLLGSA